MIEIKNTTISKCSDFCKFLIKDKVEVLLEHNEIEHYEFIHLFKCEKLNKYMKPRWASDLNDRFCFSDEYPISEKQPIECEHYIIDID